MEPTPRGCSALLRGPRQLGGRIRNSCYGEVIFADPLNSLDVRSWPRERKGRAYAQRPHRGYFFFKIKLTSFAGLAQYLAK